MYRDRLAEQLPRVRERIEEAAARSGREPGAVRIVAVTKGHPPDAVRAALSHGLVEVGENRLEELERKRGALNGATPRVRWHMVGHLQRRKAPRARGMAELLHSLDSSRLARRLERTAPEEAPPLRVLAQVNASGEASKHGFSPAGLLEALPEFLELESIRIEGLMTMAPLTGDRAAIRATFRRLRELHREIGERFDAYRGSELSMGMSNDYDLAVEEGSTLVRLGTVLFGERPA